MDEGSSLERRYSFNIARRNPVAESTHLNGSSFSWGSSMSPKHRSNSSLYISGTQTPAAFNNKSILSSKTKNSTKIDARIAVDIQSRGLASRIVRYHESGTRLNRSMSANNLYSKPGQFPAVTLKKIELPYRAVKQEISMIRIPPPEKSLYCGNTISSLLRSSSVIGLQTKRNEDLSRENRPIIHPPPTEDDMTPTRSVLDVLKEISRKRINSDNLTSEETSKKYCNRGGNDFVDTVNNKLSAIQSNYIASTLSCQRYKRQRDCITPHHDVHVPETQASPEQAKKRMCNYNNDITSSLSSSIKWKKIATHNLNQTMPTNLESYEMQKSTLQNNNNARIDMRLEDLENNLEKVDVINPITPIPETPCAQDHNNVGVAPQRTVSEPFYNSDREITKNLIQPAHKPRLTLFNKKCDDFEKAVKNESCELVPYTDNSNELNDCAGIQFVKPKKIASKSGLRNPLMERTKKSKLALMLSGLRGELYINSGVDEFDSPNDKEKLQSTKDNSENINATAVVSAVKSDKTTTSLTTVTSSSNVETPNTSNLLSLSTKISTSPPSSKSSANKTSSPLVGLKVSLSNSPPRSILSADAKETKEKESKPNVPVLGGFSFCTNNSVLATNTLSPNNNIVKDSKTTTLPIPSVPTSSNNILNFGQSTAALTLDDKINKLPVNMQLSNTSTTNTSASSNTANTLTLSKAFTLGTNVISPTSASDSSTTVASNTPFNTVATPNTVFSFAVPSTSLPGTATSSGPILFGSSACSPTLETKTTSTSIAATKTNPVLLSAVVTSENLSSSTGTPSFTFNTDKKTSTSEAKTISSTSNSLATYGINSYPATKTHPASSCLTFGSDTTTQNSSGGQTNQEVVNQIGNIAFDLNTSKLFGSQSFNTKISGGSAAAFGSVTNSLENVFSSSATTESCASSPLKPESQIFGKSANNKSSVLVTPTVFGSNSNNNSTSNLFSFGSKSAVSPTMSANNASTAPGGFSFSSAISNSAEGGTFGSYGQTNNLNNTFSGASALDSHNNFKFGSSTNKSDNSTNIFGGAVNKHAESKSPGGFSFGSATSSKTTFTFGAGNNSSGNGVKSSSNPSTGFTFGAAAAAKPNENSSNTPFSFGSPQSAQQKQIQPVPTSIGNNLNIFGLSDVNNKTTQPTAFNFNTGSSQNLQSNALTTNNMFAPPPSSVTTGPGDRPIRRATRRLQK